MIDVELFFRKTNTRKQTKFNLLPRVGEIVRVQEDDQLKTAYFSYNVVQVAYELTTTGNRFNTVLTLE